MGFACNFHFLQCLHHFLHCLVVIPPCTQKTSSRNVWPAARAECPEEETFFFEGMCYIHEIGPFDFGQSGWSEWCAPPPGPERHRLPRICANGRALCPPAPILYPPPLDSVLPQWKELRARVQLFVDRLEGAGFRVVVFFGGVARPRSSHALPPCPPA